MIWITILLASLGFSLWLWRIRRENSKDKRTLLLPPGPRGLPILGSLLKLGANPHLDLYQLSQKYGPIMHLRLGFVPTIVVSSPQAAELFLKTHDAVFASRPPSEAAKHITFDNRSMTLHEYDPYWRNMRKIYMTELLTQARLNSLRSMREEELGLLVKLLKANDDGVAVDLSAKISALTADMSCIMVLGRKYNDLQDFDDKGFKAVIQETMYLAAAPNMADYIPYLSALDLQGLTKRMKAVCKIFNDFFDKCIDEHIDSKNREGKIEDFVDALLRLQESEEHHIERLDIKGTLLDLLTGSIYTNATPIEWTMSELLKNPRVMKKVQMELETVVGMKRKVEESDLDKLKYLDMVIKESLRIHPAAPFLVPHASLEDCMVGDYFIPKNTRVIVNAWAVMRDPSAWVEPEKFWPERFEGSNIGVRGRDFQLIPFGSGRRGCPGLQQALIVVPLVVAQLVHCFDWKLPNFMLPTDLDMTELFGLTMPRANNLFAVPTYRLSPQ